MQTEQDFHSLLAPTRLDDLHFRGESLPLDSPAIYGGQLMAQVLNVAAATLQDARTVHYLQTSFVAFGDPRAPLEFEVTRIRDGRSTSHRQVLLTQGERVLLTASLSFQRGASGYEHQVAMPHVTDPQPLLDDPDTPLVFSEENGEGFPFLILTCPESPGDPQASAAVWARPRAAVNDDPLLHQMLFTFFSDATILQSALQPHALDWEHPDVMITTMNHSIWFHRPFDINQWLLLSSESPSTGNGRALSTANAFTQDGELVATLAQEGVLRSR